MFRQLKILYVSITRARKHVWIADSSETSEPMRVWLRILAATVLMPFPGLLEMQRSGDDLYAWD
jgi:hypothetical protein